MKAKELMIGDWVEPHQCMIPTVYCKVEGIYPDGTVNLDKAERLFTLDELEPIPLTEEILEKNLATEPQIAWCIGWNKKDDIHVEIKREDLNASFYGVIDFVHQLQHALRLCGIEKEIIL